MELNSKKIINALEHWAKNFDGKVTELQTLCEAVLLIKKLTEENEAWKKQLINTEEQSGKAYYELACEVEDLRAENERLKAELEKTKIP